MGNFAYDGAHEAAMPNMKHADAFTGARGLLFVATDVLRIDFPPLQLEFASRA